MWMVFVGPIGDVEGSLLPIPALSGNLTHEVEEGLRVTIGTVIIFGVTPPLIFGTRS